MDTQYDYAGQMYKVNAFIAFYMSWTRKLTGNRVRTHTNTHTHTHPPMAIVQQCEIRLRIHCCWNKWKEDTLCWIWMSRSWTTCFFFIFIINYCWESAKRQSNAWCEMHANNLMRLWKHSLRYRKQIVTRTYVRIIFVWPLCMRYSLSCECIFGMPTMNQK